MSIFKYDDGSIRWIWKLLMQFAIFIGLLFPTIVVMNIIIAAVGSGNSAAIQLTGKIGNSFFDLLIIASILIFVKLVDKKSVRYIGFKREGWVRYLITGFILGGISMTLIYIIEIISGAASPASYSRADSSLVFGLVTGFSMFILVGFAEEMLSRGFFISIIREKNKAYIAVLISSVFFSLMHIGNNAFSLLPAVNIFLVGILFALMYIWTDSLWMPIGYHISWNYFQGYIYGFNVSGGAEKGIIEVYQTKGMEIINGGAFGPEGGILTTFVILGGLLYLYTFHKKPVQ